jgi:hypothetical protein
MNNKIYLLLIWYIVSINLYSQNSKLLLDLDDYTPIEHANILFSSKLNKGTISNKEGYFALPSDFNISDSIVISHLGYRSIKVRNIDLKNLDTIFLAKEPVNLEEIVIVDTEGLLKGIKNNMSKNYYITPTIDSYFMRYFVKEDTNKTQIIESVISVGKNQYFATKKDRNYEIKIIANSNSRNIKEVNKVEFVPFSYERLFSYADVLIDFDENYKLTYERISKSHIKVSFACMDPLVLNSGPFTGYLIVNTKDKAMEEFYFQKKYNLGATNKKLKHGFSQEEIYLANKRIWKKDTSNKYRLYLMEFNGQVYVSNTEYSIEDTYSYNIIIQLVNDKTIQSSKKALKVNKENAINDYKEFNKPLVLETLESVLLRTLEQSKSL